MANTISLGIAEGLSDKRLMGQAMTQSSSALMDAPPFRSHYLSAKQLRCRHTATARFAEVN
jgi:hypothetical protein